MVVKRLLRSWNGNRLTQFARVSGLDESALTVMRSSPSTMGWSVTTTVLPDPDSTTAAEPRLSWLSISVLDATLTSVPVSALAATLTLGSELASYWAVPEEAQPTPSAATKAPTQVSFKGVIR